MEPSGRFVMHGDEPYSEFGVVFGEPPASFLAHAVTVIGHQRHTTVEVH